MDQTEKVKVLHNIRAFLNVDEWAGLKEQLGLDELGNTLDRRLAGLSAEDHLALVLLFLECCDTIVGLEQGIAPVVGEAIPPDFLCHFKSPDAGPAFVEAKSTVKDRWKIAERDLERRKNFCQFFGHPLYFAVRIRGIWGLFSTQKVEENGRKIGIPEFKHSDFNKVTGNRYVVFLPGLKIEHTYESEQSDGIGIENRDYGALVSWRLTFGDFELHIREREHPKFMWDFLLEPLYDSSVPHREIETRGSTTTVTESLRVPLIVNLYHFFLSMVTHTLKGAPDGETHSASSFLKEICATRQRTILTINLVLTVLSDMRESGIGVFLAE